MIWFTFIVGLSAGVSIHLLISASSRRRREARVREAERRAADAERLAELGSLTGGLAHEIKNPLGGVRGAIRTQANRGSRPGAK